MLGTHKKERLPFRTAALYQNSESFLIELLLNTKRKPLYLIVMPSQR